MCGWAAYPNLFKGQKGKTFNRVVIHSRALGLAIAATYNKKPRRLGRGKAALIGVSWDTGGTRVEGTYVSVGVATGL